MKRLLIICIFLLWYVISFANSYYVSASVGSDAYTASQAQNSLTPWKSITQVLANLSAGNIPAGSIIYLKRGDVWLAPRNFYINQAITFDAYGPGTIKPYITGLVTLPGARWTLKDASLGIWETTDTIFNPKSNTLNLLLINSTPYAMGRTPNVNTSNKGYLNFEAHTSSSITDNQSLFDASYTGAQIAVRTSHANLDRGQITGISGTTISFNTAAFANPLSPDNGYGYFVQDSYKCLDQFGEWFYNRITKKIDICVGQLGNPASYSIQYPYLDTVLQIQSSNVFFNNIALTGANRYLVYNDWAGLRNIWFDGMTFKYSGGDFILMMGKTYTGVTNSYAAYANSNAFVYSYHNNGVHLRNNQIYNIATYPGMLWPDNPHRYGFAMFYSEQQNLTDTGLIAENNIVKNIGYIGVFLSDGNNRIRGNFFDTTCTVLDDGSSIYISNYTPAGQTPKTTGQSIFDFNICLHSIGAPIGTADNAVMAHGIYYDDNVNHAVSIYNTCAYNGSSGIFIHNSNRNRIERNNFIGNGVQQIYMQDDFSGDSIYKDTVRYNNLLATSSSQLPYYLALDETAGKDSKDFTSFGTINNNAVLTPFGNLAVYVNHFGILDTKYTFANWQSIYHYDLNSTEMPFPIYLSSQILFPYNNNFNAKQSVYFPCISYISGMNKTYVNSITLDPMTSEVLFLNKQILQ